MKLKLLQTICILALVALLFVLPTTAYAAEEEETGVVVITNPTVIDDGRNQHQLSADALTADTQSLLEIVLNSEYIRIARRNASLLSSNAEPLAVHYSNFNGYVELLTRSDLEATLLAYIDTATAYEKEVLFDLLQRNDLQNVLSELAFSSLEVLSMPDIPSAYVIIPGFEWVEFDNEYGISWSRSRRLYFSSGEYIDAYIASREYTEDERDMVDARFAADGLQATIIHPADVSYNCHSYAWYLMSNSNPYWIGVGEGFDANDFDNGEIMYIPQTATLITSQTITLTINNPQIKDIVVYYDENGNILHSAVIVAINGSTITVQSKFGQAGVYRHTLSTIPEGYLGSDGKLRYSVYRYHIYSSRTTEDLGHSLNKHTYRHTDICSICNHTLVTTQTVSCSGPPCIMPLGLVEP